MKCQACFHHSETVKTLPPPPPTNWSPIKPFPCTPPTPDNLPQPWPNYFPVFCDLSCQTKICSPFLIQCTSTQNKSSFWVTVEMARGVYLLPKICLLSLFEQWLVSVPCFPESKYSHGSNIGVHIWRVWMKVLNGQHWQGQGGRYSMIERISEKWSRMRARRQNEGERK